MKELACGAICSPSSRSTARLILLITLMAVTGAVQEPTKPANQKAEAGAQPYLSMAPLEQYLIKDPEAEITLARTAAPLSISKDAEILVLTPGGYRTAVKGKNGFVCLVDRSWQAPFSDPEFWNPRLRAPVCLNPQAARSVLPIQIKRTQLALAGVAKSEIMTRLWAAINAKELPAPQVGAMSYMMSKEQYLGDRNLNWMPHLMIYTSNTIAASDWGANQPGSPVLEPPVPLTDRERDPVITFLIPVSQWSDGSSNTTMNGNH